MLHALRAYPTLLRAYFARALEYRVQALIQLLWGASPLVMMAVWLTMVQTGPIGGFDANAFIGYYLLHQNAAGRLCGADGAVPAELRNVLQWLPFQSSIALPVEILIGRSTPAHAWFGIAVALVWVLILTVCANAVWRAGLRNYSAVGS